MRFSQGILKGAAELIVLRAINSHNEAYGYQLIKTIASDSDKVFEFQEGTLYPLLYRLEEKKLIKSRRKKTESGKVRRYYSLTSRGKKIMSAKTSEYKTFVRALKGTLRLSA